MPIEKASLGAAIKQVRAVRRMTQVELARAAGLSDGGKSVALIEQGRRSVSMETLNALAEALQIPSACLAVLGSTRIGNNKAATDLMKSLQRLISTVLLAQHGEQVSATDEAVHSMQKSKGKGRHQRLVSAR